MNRKKDCRLTEKNLIGVAENDLEKEAFRRIKKHLEVCDRCALLSQRFAHSWQNTAPPEERVPSPSFFSSLMKDVAAYDEKWSHRRDRFVFGRRFLRPAVITLLLLAGIFAGYELGDISPDGPRPDDSFVGPLVDSLEDIPKGSVADFYIGRQSPEKAKTR